MTKNILWKVADIAVMVIFGVLLGLLMVEWITG